MSARHETYAAVWTATYASAFVAYYDAEDPDDDAADAATLLAWRTANAAVEALKRRDAQREARDEGP